MTRLLLTRLRDLMIVLFVVGVVMFVIIRSIPGDPAVAILGENATPEQLEILRESLGLSGGLLQQFSLWFFRILQGDFGVSITYSEPVLSVILTHAVPTLTLALLSTILSFALASAITLWNTVKPQSLLARGVSKVGTVGIALPDFWVALLVILLLAMQLRWFPPSGYTSLWQNPAQALSELVLPVLVLVIADTAVYLLFLRESVTNELSQLYLRTARAKGLTESRIALRHAFPNALMPILTVVGSHFAVLVGGIVIIETIFVIPGIGSLALQAISLRDYPLVQGITLFIAVLFVLVNLLVDLSYALIDPKVRVS